MSSIVALIHQMSIPGVPLRLKMCDELTELCIVQAVKIFVCCNGYSTDVKIVENGTIYAAGSGIGTAPVKVLFEAIEKYIQYYENILKEAASIDNFVNGVEILTKSYVLDIRTKLKTLYRLRQPCQYVKTMYPEIL